MRNQSPLRKTGKTIKCLMCGKEFYAPRCRLEKGRKFCSPKCAYKGRVINFHKNGGYRECSICGKDFYVASCRTKRKYCSRKCYLEAPISQETREKCSHAHKGNKSYMWRGGITSERIKRLITMEWKRTRKLVYERDNRICKRCGKKCSYTNIQCHHLKPERVSHNDNIENLITLCKTCHGITDAEYRKFELLDKQ